MRQWRITAIVYFFQWCLALILGMQVFGVLEASIGHSLEVRQLLLHYDHTVMTDFLKVHGASITPLVGQLRWLLLVWLIFAVFIDAGLLACAAAPGEASGLTFWKGGALYFFPFLKIGLFFLAVALVWTAVVWAPAAIYLEPALEYFPSEKYTVWSVWCLLAVYLAGLAVLFLWSVASRVRRMSSGTSTVAGLKNGWMFFRARKWGLLGLLAGVLGVQVVLVLAYWLLETRSGMTSPASVAVFFLLQQAFVFFRIQLRQVAYAGVCLLAGRPKHL